jgi:hypothetical protein
VGLRFHGGIVSKATVPCRNSIQGCGSMGSLVSSAKKTSIHFWKKPASDAGFYIVLLVEKCIVSESHVIGCTTKKPASDAGFSRL